MKKYTKGLLWCALGKYALTLAHLLVGVAAKIHNQCNDLRDNTSTPSETH
jgi:hypothetical protein